MLSGYWLKEFWRFTAILIIAWLVGMLAGQVVLSLVVAFAGWLAWILYKLHGFARWLISGHEPVPNYGNDLWGELYHQVNRLKNRTRRRELKLRELVGQFRASAEALPDATLVLSPDNKIEWMNQAAASLLGLDPVSDVGHRVHNLVRHPAFIEMLRSRNFSEPVEFPSPTEDGRIMEVRIVPYGDRQRLLVARDITRLHRLEAMRRDFIANVSHELSTPLTVINGYLESLSGQTRKPEQLQQVFSRMQQQTDRMHSLVNDLLQISRLELNEAPAPENEVDVAAMLTGLVEELGLPGQPRQHEISLEVDRQLFLHGIDKDLYSAFSNLLRNAAQYTPDGGRIEVRWYRDQDTACCAVRDSGIGIPREVIPRLTERFYRVDAGRSRALGGTGLGLAIVKHVLRNHQAKLEVESTVGKGSEFRCRFPSDRIINRPG